MQRIHLVLLITVLASQAAIAGPACPSTAGADPNPTFDASLLKEGRFTYQTTLKGESLGETVIEIRRVHGDLRITMSAPKVAQSWEAIVGRTFSPRSASLQMRGKRGAYSMKLLYTRTSVSGEESESGITRPVSAALDGLVLDQRVDWAAMMVATASEKSVIAMRVFDPGTGLSQMVGKVAGVQSIRRDDGEVAALRLDYSICKRDHLEEYSVYATREAPRYMLREDMPNGLTSELVRIDP
jgi:hypothetical protein